MDELKEIREIIESMDMDLKHMDCTDHGGKVEIAMSALDRLEAEAKQPYIADRTMRADEKCKNQHCAFFDINFEQNCNGESNDEPFVANCFNWRRSHAPEAKQREEVPEDTEKLEDQIEKYYQGAEEGRIKGNTILTPQIMIRHLITAHDVAIRADEREMCADRCRQKWASFVYSDEISIDDMCESILGKEISDV
jgi:hypothetical protein